MPLDTFETTTAERTKGLAVSQEFVHQINEHGQGFALFVGNVGTGKTRLACGIVRELERHAARYVRQAQLTLALRATYGRKEIITRRASPAEDERDNPPSPLEVGQRAEFLVLDEIGCLALANDEALLIDELLKFRYDNRKPTILISNLGLAGLKTYLGDALFDRIIHATGNGQFILQFKDKSYRRGTGDDYLRERV